MLIILKLLSYPMWFMGLGVLPIFWNPMRQSCLQKISFFCYTCLLLSFIWFDRELLFFSFFSKFILSVSRFLLMYFALWWNQGSRRYGSLVCSILILAITTMLFMSHPKKKSVFEVYYETFGSFVYNTLSKCIHFFVPALYLTYIAEFTHLFQQADSMWKEELRSVLAGSLNNNLQSIRIFHSEISSVIFIFKKSFSINLLLYFAFAFLDILIAFQSFSDDYEDYELFVSLVFSGSTSIFLMVKFTQDLTVASEEIVSDLKSLELSNLPNLDQLQVELMVKKVQCCPVVIDVCGIFVINRQLLAEIAMGATTYCNAIVQLRPYIRIKHLDGNTTMPNFTEN